MYNHAFDIAFEVVTDKESHQVTEQELFEALEKRIKSLKQDGSILEAVGCYDTHEE